MRRYKNSSGTAAGPIGACVWQSLAQRFWLWLCWLNQIKVFAATCVHFKRDLVQFQSGPSFVALVGTVESQVRWQAPRKGPELTSWMHWSCRSQRFRCFGNCLSEAPRRGGVAAARQFHGASRHPAVPGRQPEVKRNCFTFRFSSCQGVAFNVSHFAVSAARS